MSRRPLDPRRYLHPHEIRVLRAWLERERAWAKRGGRRVRLRDTHILETLLASGLRRFEVAGLRVGDVPATRGLRRLHVVRGKGGQPRDVPIPGALRSSLHDWLRAKAALNENTATEAPLFASIRGGGHLGPEAIHRIWAKARDAAGLQQHPGVAVHAARHGAAVALYRRTGDILLVKELLGHANLSTTMVYARLLEEDVERGLDDAWDTTAPEGEDGR